MDGRAEKRRQEREEQKIKEQWAAKDRVNMAWYKSLPVSRKMFIGRFVEREAIKNDNIVAMIMDKCILAAMDDNTDLSIILMKKIIKEYNNYILEYKEFLDKYKDGGMNMIESTITRDEIKLKMKKMIIDGVEKVKGMAELKKLYNIPAAELSETWIDCKVELDQEKKLKKKEEKEKEPDKSSVVCTGRKFENHSTEIKVSVVVPGLQVIDEVKVIKGQFGYYHKSKSGIRFSNGEKLMNDDVIYSSKDELIKEKEQKVASINNTIQDLKNRLKELEDDRVTYFEKYNELEQVFDM